MSSKPEDADYSGSRVQSFRARRGGGRRGPPLRRCGTWGEIPYQRAAGAPAGQRHAPFRVTGLGAREKGKRHVSTKVPDLTARHLAACTPRPARPPGERDSGWVGKAGDRGRHTPARRARRPPRGRPSARGRARVAVAIRALRERRSPPRGRGRVTRRRRRRRHLHNGGWSHRRWSAGGGDGIGGSALG